MAHEAIGSAGEGMWRQFLWPGLLSDPPPLSPVPSTAQELLHINKPDAAGFPEATGWTAKEGTEV